MAESVLTEQNIQTTAERILQTIPAGGTITSWELKMKLHLSSPVLYLALGRLHCQGKIKLEQDQLNYIVSASA